MSINDLSSGDLISKAIASGIALVDDNKQTWNLLVDQMLRRGGRIIALRGAGSVNGMDKLEADQLLTQTLIPSIEKSLRNGPVTILYDGDNDELEKPDIGYIAGRLLARFGNILNGVLFVAVQKEGWYSPKGPGSNITNAQNQDFLTYIFKDEIYPNEHSEFTQDPRLVAYARYEQWYIGASGKIAESQLIHYNNAVPDGKVRYAAIFRLRNNPNLDTVINERLKLALESGEPTRIEKFERQLKFRKFIFGVHWNNDGTPRISSEDFPNLYLSFITP